MDDFSPRTVVVYEYKPVDDATFTFRVNSGLKRSFSNLCHREMLTPSAVIKRYMDKCVQEQKIK